jgi:hypothetical protein
MTLGETFLYATSTTSTLELTKSFGFNLGFLFDAYHLLLS